jgi:hypothetical protein
MRRKRRQYRKALTISRKRQQENSDYDQEKET